MEEQLIGFKVAKLAAKKGFNIGPTKNWYTRTGNFNSYSPKTPYWVVTQSLLQKWLRDKHKIQLCLQPLYGGSKIDGKQIGWLCYTPFQDEDFNNLQSASISLSQYTYEEALEKGLQEALKLI